MGLHVMSDQELPVSATPAKPAKVEVGVKLRGAEKLARIPVKIIPTDDVLRKPDWIRVRVPVSPKVESIKQTLRKHKLHSVCEEATFIDSLRCFIAAPTTSLATLRR